MNQNLKEYGGLPLEVQLAWKVMTCRAMRSTYDAPCHACHWFNNHYGPYPAYDWISKLPPVSPEGEEEKEYEARCVGERFQVPELMSGCRKAPIMTIGINPNLTAYYPSAESASWCYPYFDDISQYAYYFRHRAVCQEHFSVGFIKNNVIKGTEITAKKDGKVDSKATSWSQATGGLSLTLKYNDESSETLELEPGYKVLASGFSQGEIIAGKVKVKDNVKTMLYRKPVGYYMRFQSIFDTFKKLAGPEVEKLPLRMGEDVCQGDMVACASPGWGKWFTDTAREGIAGECVEKRQWLVLQLLQTNPPLIVFSGGSAFSMFYDVMKEYIQTDLDLEADTYELLKKCLTDPILLKIDLGSGQKPVNARIAISPHFSYNDNFRPQSRFTAEEWEQYKKEYPDAFEKLQAIAVTNFDNTRVLVFMDGDKAPTEAEVGPEVWKILQDHLYNAQELIAQIILDEYNKGNIQVEGEHFKRNDGPCKFCVNELFAFTEGCPYGKIESSRKEDENILKSIFKAAKNIFK